MADEVLLTAGDIGLPLLHRGKVREVFDLGDKLMFVATDRLSAFDVVFNEGVPGKGRVLTELAALWFAATARVVPNHFVTMNLNDVAVHAARISEESDDGPKDESVGRVLPRADKPFTLTAEMRHRLDGRTMIGLKTERVDVECVVRGYLSGSGWAEYKRSGTVCGITLPPGLRLNERLPEPIFTPALKVDDGHDVNVPFEEVERRYGAALAAELKDKSLRLYNFGVARARAAGLILADTKFEFGLRDGELIVIDEMLTPDSSRFWPEDRYVVGEPVDSLDKQPVRDYLQSTDWNKEPPPPPLPPGVIEASAARYEDVLRRLKAVLT